MNMKGNKMKDLIIVGAGGFGRELLQWVKDINKVNPTWNVLGFIDDNPDALQNYACDYSVIGTIQEWQPKDNEEFALAIANPDIKEIVSKLIKDKGGKFAKIIHPTATIGDFNELGEGLVMYPNSRITVNVKIGDFVTILGNTSIGHDAVVDNYCTISGSCNLTRGVVLREKVFLSCNVSVVPERKIGKGAYVCAGSTVMTNIRSGYKVMGCPAKKVSF